METKIKDLIGPEEDVMIMDPWKVLGPGTYLCSETGDSFPRVWNIPAADGLGSMIQGL